MRIVRPRSVHLRNLGTSVRLSGLRRRKRISSDYGPPIVVVESARIHEAPYQILARSRRPSCSRWRLTDARETTDYPSDSTAGRAADYRRVFGGRRTGARLSSLKDSGSDDGSRWEVTGCKVRVDPIYDVSRVKRIKAGYKSAQQFVFIYLSFQRLKRRFQQILSNVGRYRYSYPKILAKLGKNSTVTNSITKDTLVNYEILPIFHNCNLLKYT